MVGLMITGDPTMNVLEITVENNNNAMLVVACAFIDGEREIKDIVKPTSGSSIKDSRFAAKCISENVWSGDFDILRVNGFDHPISTIDNVITFGSVIREAFYE